MEVANDVAIVFAVPMASESNLRPVDFEGLQQG